ncbi:MAG TPA: CbiX/SirB N-terminal domain-containing protein [Desulfomicrobiaceae bacterium]|nr:CbiX/SirB N-terminal domain-containing protein [Desulfomicrobiaceae bacterium]
METGIIILGHGSRKREVGDTFNALVRRIAKRTPGAAVVPAFFSLGTPTLSDQVGVLVDRGAERVVIMPYFLYNGVHVETDIPALVGRLEHKYPQVRFKVLPTLENDPELENLLVDRVGRFGTHAGVD